MEIKLPLIQKSHEGEAPLLTWPVWFPHCLEFLLSGNIPDSLLVLLNLSRSLASRAVGISFVRVLPGPLAVGTFFCWIVWEHNVVFWFNLQFKGTNYFDNSKLFRGFFYLHFFLRFLGPLDPLVFQVHD
jgi:hypothetical protein